MTTQTRPDLAGRAPAPPERPLRRNTGFQLLWVGSVVSGLGSQLTALAYPLVILAMTGSAAVAGMVGAASMASGILFGLPAGALVDRWDRRRIMLVCEALRVLMIGSVALALYGGWATVPHLALVAVLQGAIGTLFYPARIVAVRGLVPDGQLRSALAQEEARTHAASLAGPPLGGALLAIGQVVPFLVDAATYVVSFVCIVLARVPRRPAAAGTGTTSTTRDATTRDGGIGRDIIDGLRWLLAERVSRSMLAILPVFNIAGAGVGLLVIVLLRSRGASAATIGLVLASQGVAGLVGALAAARIARLLPPGRLLLAMAWSWAVLLALMPLPIGWWWVALVLAAGVVMTPTLTVVVTNSILQAAPAQLQGRAMSALGTVSGAIRPLGPLAAGALAELFGPVPAMLAFAGYLAVCAALATSSPYLRGSVNPAPTPAKGVK